MQKRCEKKKEGEALQLCLPRWMPHLPPAAPRQTFSQAVAQPAFRIPKCQSQPAGHVLTKPPESKSSWAKKPTSTSVTPGDRAVPPVTHGTKKKRRATQGDASGDERWAQPDANAIPPQRSSVSLVQIGMFRHKRCTEAREALTVHSPATKGIRPAESSVEPQLSLTSTHQCHFPQVKCLINLFQSTLAAEGTARNIKNKRNPKNKRGTELMRAFAQMAAKGYHCPTHETARKHICREQCYICPASFSMARGRCLFLDR